MAIFNSLGSNYTLGFALQALLAPNSRTDYIRLCDFLYEKYKGQALLTYKGRDALRFVLRILGRENCAVGICGYTCYAVYESVVQEGYRPVYLDIDNRLNFSFETLVAAKNKHPEMRVLIVQNTLGFSCDIEKIAAFCREKDIVLIEDLAHSIGAKYSNGQEAGMIGDFVVLSFSQDKMIDGISGGALIIKNYEVRITNYGFGNVSFMQQMRDRFYPLFTFFIRKTYDRRLGKVLHRFLKKLKLLSAPMEHLEKDTIYGLANWYSHLILRQFNRLENDLIHRRKIASLYANRLSKEVMSEKIVKEIDSSANLRFPIFVALRKSYEGRVKDRESLIGFLKDKKIFVSDIWYDAPIAPMRFLPRTDYKNQCPHSEKISGEMLNLPTHRNVNEKDAEFIAESINEWVNTN